MAAEGSLPAATFSDIISIPAAIFGHRLLFRDKMTPSVCHCVGKNTGTLPCLSTRASRGKLAGWGTGDQDIPASTRLVPFLGPSTTTHSTQGVGKYQKEKENFGRIRSSSLYPLPQIPAAIQPSPPKTGEGERYSGSLSPKNTKRKNNKLGMLVCFAGCRKYKN